MVVVSAAPAAHADPGGIVISELNYHAVSDLDGDDFIELTNTGSAAIDLSGWSFTSGISGTIAAGTVVPAGGRIVLGKDAAQFQATYGFAPQGIYGGNLANGSETVTLADASLATIDTVTYADVPPWPVEPDAGGPTLELRSLLSDNTVAENWGASLATGGTPAARNSIDGQTPAPVVTGLTANPTRPSASQPVAVSARLVAGSTATLTYKIMFGADVQVPFRDDAASPGGAGDGVYGATIPGQAAGSLIRYRVDATSGGVNYSAPAEADTVRYRGVVVPSSSNSQLPIIQWFMEDAVYNDLRANHRHDDVQGAAVWAYDGEVIDNVLMNIRGGTSRNSPKVNWKVELPKGYTFDLGGRMPYPLDEFALQNMNANFADVAWDTVKAAGARGLAIEPVRTERNGAFWSLGRIMETQDGEWRDDQGVDDWAIYKGDGGRVGRQSSAAALEASGWLDKKTREDEDFTDVWTLSNTIDAPASPAQQRWIYENVNIPELVNYLAINSLIRHEDSGWHNWYLARDTEGTGRWEMWFWDLDLTFSTPERDGKGEYLTPDSDNRFHQAMLRYPEIREMFFRRLRTLSDEFLTPGEFEAKWDAISARTTPDWNLDRAMWGSYAPAGARTHFINGLADRRNVIANNTGPGRPVPASQSANASLVISELMHSSGTESGDFIELTNTGSTAVDMSGWTIGGIGLTAQPGTVVPAGARIVFVEDDVAFRSVYTGANRLVGGEFSGGLSGSGELVELRDGTRVVDSVTYGTTAPWPTAVAGASLELTNLSADNADPANWTAASPTGGTPGLPNSGGTTPPANVAPVASFTSSVSGLVASLNGSGSTDSDGTIASHSWNFGDGTSGTGATTSKTYATSGTYQVTLTVTDNAGATHSVTRAVTVSSGTTPPPTGDAFAQDAFERTSTNGLGSAEVGGAWTPSSTTSNYAVNGGTAKVSTPAGSTRNAYLNATSSTDADIRTTISFTRPTSGSAYVGVFGRRVGTSDYRARAVVNSTGRVQAQVLVNGSTVQTTTISGFTFGTNDSLQLRTQMTGTSPTTIRVKIWRTGTTEPTAWTITRTDTTAALQTAGSIGLYSYFSSGGATSPLVVNYDNLTATPTAG